MLFRSDRKSTRLNSSHTLISYAVFCLKKKKNGRAHADCAEGRYTVCVALVGALHDRTDRTPATPSASPASSSALSVVFLFFLNKRPPTKFSPFPPQRVSKA